MDAIIDSIVKLFSTYGFRSAAIIIATVVIVNIIKKPITKKANTLPAGKKAMLTRYVTLLPVPIAFALELLSRLAGSGFDFKAVNYAEILSSAILYGALAVSVYESIKKQLEAYAVTRNNKSTDNGENDGNGDDTPPPALPAEPAEKQSETQLLEPPVIPNPTVSFTANG